MNKISMRKVQERLNRVLSASGRKVEAVKPGRAWSGKIKNIDNLLSWMYDKDILNKTEKQKKDTIFHSYYRYYNDGDFPRILSPLGISKYSPDEKIETALEEVIEAFIKKILAKYAGKYSRKDFHLDQYIKQLNDVIEYTSIGEANPSSINFWVSEIANPDEEIAKWNDEMQSIYKKYEEAAKKYDKDPAIKKRLEEKYIGSINRYAPPYMKEILDDLWPAELESYKSKMDNLAKKMNDKLLKVKEAALKLKNNGVI